MAFRIKRKGPTAATVLSEQKYEDAIHAAVGLIMERLSKSQTSITNLKTGETLNEQEIEEAALAIGPLKRRAKAV